MIVQQGIISAYLANTGITHISCFRYSRALFQHTQQTIFFVPLQHLCIVGHYLSIPSKQVYIFNTMKKFIVGHYFSIPSKLACWKIVKVLRIVGHYFSIPSKQQNNLRKLMIVQQGIISAYLANLKSFLRPARPVCCFLYYTPIFIDFIVFYFFFTILKIKIY